MTILFLKKIILLFRLNKMNQNLVVLAKELSRTKPEDLPEKFLQLDRRIFQNSFSL